MKHILFILFLLPAAGFAQTQKDYEHAMARFVKFYNGKMADSITNMWPPEDRTIVMWKPDDINDMHKKYGKILEVRYIGIDTDDPNPGLAVFKTQFSKAGWKTTSLTLEDKHYLSTFRFITRSDGIDKMLKAQK